MKTKTTHFAIVALLLGLCVPTFAQEYVTVQDLYAAQRAEAFAPTIALNSANQWNQMIAQAQKKLEQQSEQAWQEFLENYDYLVEADPQFAEEMENLFNNYEQLLRANLDQFNSRGMEILASPASLADKERQLNELYGRFTAGEAAIKTNFVDLFLEKVLFYQINFQKATIAEETERIKSDFLEANKETLQLFPQIAEEIGALYDEFKTEALATYDGLSDAEAQIIQDATLTAEEKFDRINELIETANEQVEQILTAYDEQIDNIAQSFNVQLQQAQLQALKKQVRQSKKDFTEQNFSPAVRKNHTFKRKVNKAYARYYYAMKKLMYNPGSESEYTRKTKRYYERLQEDLNKIVREYAGK